MVSRANLSGRGDYIKSALEAAKANKPRTHSAGNPEAVARTTKGGLIGPIAQAFGAKKRAAGPAGEATSQRRGGIAGTAIDFFTRQRAAEATQQEAPPAPTRQAKPFSDAMTGFLDRSRAAQPDAGPSSERTLATGPGGRSPYSRHVRQQYKPTPGAPPGRPRQAAIRDPRGPAAPKTTPAAPLVQQEPNLGGSQSRNGVSEPTANRSRASRSRRIIR